MSLQLRDGLANKSLDHILEDLLVRFVVNVPTEDLSSVERVLFQVEEAQWFYTDFLRQQYPGLPSLKMKSFSGKILEKCPLIWKWGNPSEAVSIFGKYKSTIPVRGIALFNGDLSKVLLVKGYESNHWSFPRGKISKDEKDIDCAVREVEEETGFNAKDLINEDDYIERTIHGKNYKIYLVKNVPEDYNFEPHVRNEIEKIEWFDIKTLQKKVKYNTNNFFIIPAIIKPMIRWIQESRGILNEHDLMLEAEIKLKNLLGVGQTLSSNGQIMTTQTNEVMPNNDAGRELLDILQGIAPSVPVESNELASKDEAIIEEDEPQDNVSNDDGTPKHAQPEFTTPTVSIPESMAAPYSHLMSSNLPQQLELNPIFKAPSHSTHAPASLPLANPYTPLKPSQLPQPGQVFTPHPDSFEKPPSSLINSKELLSILTNKNKQSKESSISDDVRRKEDSLKNKAKANELMRLFNKKTESLTSNNNSLTDNDTDQDYQDSHLTTGNSNELERSIHENDDIQPGKFTLLKKADKNLLLDILKRSTPERSPSPHSPSNDLLGLLKKPLAPVQPTTSQTSQASQSSQSATPDSRNELLGILHKDKPVPSHDLLGLLKRPTPSTEVLHSEPKLVEPVVPVEAVAPVEPAVKPANDLLKLLKKPEKNQEIHPSVEPTENPANDLLGILKKPEQVQKSQEPETETKDEFDEFEDFEDFEDFDALNDEIQATTQEYYTPEPELGSTPVPVPEAKANSKLVPSTPSLSQQPHVKVQSPHTNNQYEQYQNYGLSSSNTTPDISKHNIRILKPGESLNKKENSPGNELLLLLQYSNPHKTSQSQLDHLQTPPTLTRPIESPNNSLNAIYGTPQSTASSLIQSPPVPQASRDSNASASLLGLLNGPRKNESPEVSNAGPPSNAANDLLNLLKRPSNN